MSRDRQRDDLYSLVLQGLDLPGRRGTANVAFRRFAVMDLTCFFGEGGADILGSLNHVIDQFCECFAVKISVLLGHACGIFSCPIRPLAATGIDIRCMRQAHHLAIATQRASQRSVVELPLKILVRGEPAFKTMFVLAA